MTRILIAEDEPRIASFLEKGLQAHGFATTVAEDGIQTAYMGRSEDFELLILDLGLPKKNGNQVIEELRGRGEYLPIIVLTVIQDIKNKVKALEDGADDYLTKPFSLEELIARIRVQLRHQQIPRHGETTVIKAGDLSLDLRQHKVEFKGKIIELSTREFILLERLARYPGQLWTRDDLINQIWGYDYDPNSNIVDVYIGYLRKKLGRGLIKTIRGMGYRLEV